MVPGLGICKAWDRSVERCQRNSTFVDLLFQAGNDFWQCSLPDGLLVRSS